MNVVLFCRILYVDFETLTAKSVENRNTMSKDKVECEDNSEDNSDLNKEQIEENDEDFHLDDSLCVDSLGNTINQNISNGCHQRKQLG